MLSCPPVFPDEYDEFNDEPSLAHLSIVIFGASGDLARRKTLYGVSHRGKVFVNNKFSNSGQPFSHYFVKGTFRKISTLSYVNIVFSL